MPDNRKNGSEDPQRAERARETPRRGRVTRFVRRPDSPPPPIEPPDGLGAYEFDPFYFG